MSWKMVNCSRVDILRIMLDLGDSLRDAHAKIVELEAATYSAGRPMPRAQAEEIRRHSFNLRCALDSEACRIVPRISTGEDLALSIFMGPRALTQSEREKLLFELEKRSD